MAVITNCESIIAAYTHCENVIAIYTHCQLVWPLGPVPPGQWYVSWRPSTVTGEFYMWGSTRRYEDYPDCIYSWSGPASTSGLINGNFPYYSSTGEGGMTYMETNVKSIGADTFNHIRTLEVISCSRAKYIGEDAFSYCINLQYVSLSRCTFIDSGAFDQCSNVSYAYLPRVSSISAFAFDMCSNLSSLYAPVLEYVGQAAFQTTALPTLDLPACSYIATGAFAFCSSLSEVSLPACEFIGNGAFQNCDSLTSVYLPACTSTYGGFEYCDGLVTADLPVCSMAGPELFMNCTALRSVNLPVCEYFSEYAFSGCVRLQSIELPGCKSLHNEVFIGCTTLSYIDLGMCSYIGRSAFSGCISLTTLILRSMKVCSLNTDPDAISDTFRSTPILSCSGAIYVHPAILGQYRTAPGWSYLSCALRSFEAEPGEYYVNWTPSTLLGSFSLDGNTYYFNDFDGSFPWMENSVITSSAFSGTGVSTIDTNASKIEDYAFYGCTRLSHIDMSYCTYIGKYAFYGTSLTSVDITGVKYIGSYAFGNCSGLIVDELSSPVLKYIGDSAFDSTMKSTLQRIDLPVCSYIGSDYSGYSLLSYMNIPSVKSIYSYMFSGCSSLKTVILNDVSYIGDYAFYGCSVTFSGLSLPMCEYIGFGRLGDIDGVVSLPVCSYLGSYCFQSTGITEVYLPSLISKGSGVFAYCSSLVGAYLPVLSVIGNMDFFSCSSLTTVDAQNVLYVGEYAFAYCTSLTSINLPMCSSVGSYAFNGCGLVEISLPVLTNLGTSAFTNCSSLKSAYLPMCTSVRSYAFYFARSLELVDFRCSRIYDETFDYTSLKTLIIRYDSGICSLSGTRSYAFSHTGITPSTGSIYVPASRVSTYKTYSRWSMYSNIIYSIPEP